MHGTVCGILFGLGAAMLMALSYLSSGWALRRTPGLTPEGMLCNALQGMLLISLVGLFFVWCNDLALKIGHYIMPLLGVVFFYTLGQGLIFMVQREVDASRIVPLLGLKLPMLALLNLLAFRQHFSWLQIAAIAITVMAAFVLNNAGKRIGLTNIFLVLVGSASYCFSDTFIKITVARMQDGIITGLARASAATTFCSYIICGLLGVAIVRLGPKSLSVKGAALHSLPFALFWVPSIVFLGICFGLLGTVGGNIIQASRGLLAMLIVLLLNKFGFYKVDGKVSGAIVMRRLLAALMIIVAALLYNL